MDFQSIPDLIKQAPDSGAAFVLTAIGLVIIFFIVTKILRIFALLAFIWVMGVVVASLQGYDVSSITAPITNYVDNFIQSVKDKARSTLGNSSSSSDNNTSTTQKEKEIEKDITTSIDKMTHH